MVWACHYNTLIAVTSQPSRQGREDALPSSDLENQRALVQRAQAAPAASCVPEKGCHPAQQPYPPPLPNSQHAREETDLSNLLSEKKRQLHNAALVGCFLVSIAICAIVLLLIPFQLRSPEVHVRSEDVCTSRACYLHERFLLQTMDPKANHCHAFGTYMCGRWTDDYPALRDLEALLRKDALQEGASCLRFHPHKSRVAAKASRMLQSCLEQPEKTARDVSLRSFRAFLRARGLFWPNDPLEDRHPLDVLLDLSVNWGIDLWFRLRARKEGFARLQIMEVPVTWSLLARSEHADDLQAVTEAMLYAKELGAGLLYNKTRALSVYRTEGSVLDSFESGFSASGRPSRLLVSQAVGLARWTPTVTSKQWLHFLRKHLSDAVKVHASTEVLVDSSHHLSAVGDLLKKFTPKELLDVIGWWVARLYSDLTALAVNKDQEAQAIAPLVCQRRVEACYGLAVASETVALYWTVDLREHVENIFDAIKNQAILLVHRCSWMDVMSKRNVIQKLDAIKLSIWPDDVDDNALDDIYNEFPVQESRYIDYWLKAKEAMRSLLGKPEGRRLQQYLTAGSDPLAEYNYWDNTLSV
ncbi:neprilysin-1-like [Amblyomma americanum]